jgi:soluble P-type ATPase
VSITLDVPGHGLLELEHLVLDVNGTLTDRGDLVDGVQARLARLREALEIHLLSADTFGTLSAVAWALDARAVTVSTGEEKLAYLTGLGAARCAAIGNGANDEHMLEAGALGIAVVGREGAAGAALRAADVVCGSVLDALDLLLDGRALVATLRR